MKSDLLEFISTKSFPCIMARAVAKKGNLCLKTVEEIENEKTITHIQDEFYSFIKNYLQSPKKLHSFILVIKNNSYRDFASFEKNFWHFLIKLNELDKKKFSHDPRVGSNWHDHDFSYSLMQEAFFILALHPQSPRLSRRFKYPTIVFNPHQQFEQLRKNGSFFKIRNIIRSKDQQLQGSVNPMLNDFGEESEVFQYLGRMYQPYEILPPPLQKVRSA